MDNTKMKIDYKCKKMTDFTGVVSTIIFHILDKKKPDSNLFFSSNFFPIPHELLLFHITCKSHSGHVGFEML